MDQNSWLWKKRSTEKTLAAEKANNSFTKNEEEETEVMELLTENVELERDLRILSERVSAALSDCSSKDSIPKKQVKITQEAITGWEKAKREAISLKKDLDKVSEQKAASDERLSHLEAAFKECMQQLRFVREEQEKRIHSAVIKASEEFEKTRIALNEKLVEAGKRIAKLDAENTQFYKALSGKERVIEELSRYRTQVEADLKALMLRVESTEKENASLKYEVRVLEKELDIRNEEGEVNRRTADIAQKQHQESVKKIAKLESECQRLRLLVRRRLPGPAALTKMKNEVEMIGKDQIETRRRRSNPSLISSMDFRVDVAADTPSKRINFLTEQLLRMEEENRSLQYALTNKSSELQFSRNTYARTQVEGSFKGQTLSDLGSDDKASYAESSASALISELEHFKNEKQLGTPSNAYMGTSEMNLMDDFAEMEKLAIVSLDYPAASSHHSSEEGNAVDSSGNKSFNLEVSDTGHEKDISTTKKNDQKLESNVSIQIHKILELLGGINLLPQDNGAAESFLGKDDTPTGYMVRVFQWKTAGLSAVLRQFSQTCNDLLNGKGDAEQFVQLVASSLDWVMNHCFSLQDVSSMKDAIRSRLDWDESRSESGEDSGSANHSAESTRLNIQREDVSYAPMVSPLNGHNTEAHQPNTKEEAKIIMTEQATSGTSTINLEGRVRSQIVKGKSNRIQLEDSEDVIENLQSEKETTRQSIGNTGDQIEKSKMMKEGLEIQFMETNLEQGKACQKISHMEDDLGNTSNSFERKEDTCNGQKTQLKSKTSKEGQDDGKPSRKQLQNDWEFTEASEKLAECQETILNLGKQLKALASPRDAALFDKVIPTPDHVITSTPTPRRIVSKRFSLQDKMLEEDHDQNGASPRTTDDTQNNSAGSTNAAVESWSKFTDPNGIDREADTTAVVSMAVVPRKKNESRSLLKKLFLWKKKGNRKKTLLLSSNRGDNEVKTQK